MKTSAVAAVALSVLLSSVVPSAARAVSSRALNSRNYNFSKNGISVKIDIMGEDMMAMDEDPQTSRTLLESQIQANSARTGQETPTPAFVNSLTSQNNFINWCATSDLPLTNGQLIPTGSCNPIPMGIILPGDKMPTSKFLFPRNFGTIEANKDFDIQMKMINIVTGSFVNPNVAYYSAPAHTDENGYLIGHSHIVIQKMTSLDSTDMIDGNDFVFFKGFTAAAVDGVYTATVTDGLPAGAYRLASLNAAANHQGPLVALAQHGALDDMIYFTIA